MPTQKRIRWSARILKESLIEVLAGDARSLDVEAKNDLMIIPKQPPAIEVPED